MSGASGSGAPPPAGVVCNSALSFVASAQALPTENETPPVNLQGTNRTQMTQAEPIMPVGLKALCDACSKLYPDQPNPLQVTTRLKYWLGGEDPLDYISMYWNPGKPEEHIPPHWHYISFGISDLHGDGRVHARSERSGFSFELTFRLSGHTTPPLWPAALMQQLARYVFITGNRFQSGDHITWHRPLDGAGGRVRHMLVGGDVTLGTVHTPHGSVDFLQIVGCTRRELRAAQRGSGFEVLKLMKEDPNSGGPYLVTCMERASDVPLPRPPPLPLPRAPATLAGVECSLRWARVQKSKENLSVCIEQQIKDTLQRGLSAMSTDSHGKGAMGHMSTDSFEMSSIGRALPQLSDTHSSCGESESIQHFDSVHVYIDREGASLLPLALDGRISHGQHFTWRCHSTAVTILSPDVSGAFVTDKCAACAGWLQVIITPSLAAQLRRQYSAAGSGRSDSDTDSDSDSGAPYTLTTDVISFTVT